MTGRSLVGRSADAPVGRGQAPGGADAGGVDLGTVFHDLVRLETMLWNVVETRLRAEHDLTLGRFEVMRWLAGHPRCRVQDIAAGLVITVGGTSKLVDRIEAHGDCRRRANPADRRSFLIELTGAGRRRLDRAAATVDDELRRQLGAAVPTPHLNQLGGTLATLRAAVTASTDSEHPEP